MNQLRTTFTSDGQRWTYHARDGVRTFDFRMLQGSWPDNEEWLAQGRLEENARHKRRMNALPFFPTRRAALEHYEGIVA